MKLSEIGEEALIERLTRRFDLPTSGQGLLTGVGDDAAVLAPPDGGLYMLVTTDMLTERMDYLLDMATPYQIGWKSVAANISDIAAMGGLPTFTFVSLGLRSDTEVEFLDELYRGITECAGRFASTVAGGDMNAVKGDSIVSITQLGQVEPGRLARRTGAKVGDRVLVTGCLGDSRGGLELLLRFGLAESSRISRRLVEAQYLPIPRVSEARAAVERGAVHAMMDLSDGLAADLPKLCRASGVGALIHADTLPISDDLSAASDTLGCDAVGLAADGGEDFELLMTVASKDVPRVIDAVQGVTGTAVTEIGEITEGAAEILFADGTRRALKGGWQYFA
jgi:thiamine-monophosphate kinase